MTDTPYNEKGYYRDGLRAPAQQRYLADQPPGTYVKRGIVPPGILIVENFLTARQCQRIVDYAAPLPGIAATVQDQDGGSARDVARSHTRITDYIPIDGIRDTVLEIVRDAFTGLAATHYGQRVRWHEKPEILRYRTGGHYEPHVDAENWDAVHERWVRRVDRDLSLLLYLNADFTGGELDFGNFGLRLGPQPGMLVMFPSDHRYVHAARPTLSGVRYVLVCWAALADRPLTGDGPPPGATLLDEGG